MNVAYVPNALTPLTQSSPSSLFSKYLGRCFKTFDALPNKGKAIEVIKRIIVIASAAILLPLLGVIAVTERVLRGKVAAKEVKSSVPEEVMVAKAYTTRPIQIAHYEISECRGHDVQRLQAIQAEIDKRGIPLHVCPKRPENVHPVNYEKANAYIASLPATHKATFEKLWKENFLHISMQDFDIQLKDCVDRYNEVIKKQNYVVGFASGKSSQWVASLALKNLESLPTSWITLGHQQTNNAAGYQIHTPDEELILPDDDRLPIVIFDDCGYSGSQLTQTFRKIAEDTKTRRTVYLVVPYISEVAHNTITTYMKKYQQAEKLDITLITSEKRIPWIGDNLSNEERHLVRDLFPRLNFAHHMFLCVTDWRIPDNLPSGFGTYAMKHAVKDHIQSETQCSGCEICLIKTDEHFIASAKDVSRPYSLPERVRAGHA